MLFDLFRNYLNALVGRNQEFEKLINLSFVGF